MLLKAIIIEVLLTVAMCGYSPSIARELVYFSQIAYQPATSINAWNCPNCPSFPIKDQKSFINTLGSLQGYAGYVPKLNAILVAFRGTVDYVNWILNLVNTKSTYSACSGCQVHSGFKIAYDQLSSSVKGQVSRLLGIYKGTKLVFTGHSLGGALAVLASLDMKSVFGNIGYVYTFGQPRVGNSQFAQYYTKNIPQSCYIVNYADMIPHNPTLEQGFKHGGNEIWYNPRGMSTYRICSAQSSSCSNSISAYLLLPTDHMISNYLKLDPNSKANSLLQSLGISFLHSIF